MTTLVALECKARSDSVDTLIGFMQKHLPDTRNFEGCQDITAYLGEDGLSVIMVEHWDTKAHYEKYLAWRQETGVFADLGAMLDGEPSIRFFEPIDA